MGWKGCYLWSRETAWGGGGERGAEIGRKGDKLFPNDIVRQQNKMCFFSFLLSPLLKGNRDHSLKGTIWGSESQV